MSRIFVVTALALALSLLRLPLAAHQEEGDQAAEVAQVLDCSHLPAAALTDLPEPVRGWSQLDCQSAGQRLVQGAGWIWRYPGSWLNQVIVPSYTADVAAAEAMGLYFVRFNVVTRTGADAARLHETLMREVRGYAEHLNSSSPEAASPQTVYTLEAFNEHGRALRLHFLAQAPDDLWGVVCAPQCESQNVFKAYANK